MINTYDIIVNYNIIFFKWIMLYEKVLITFNLLLIINTIKLKLC